MNNMRPLLVLAMLSALGTLALAQGIDVEHIPARKVRGSFQYTAKVVCGVQGDPTSSGPTVVASIYRTAVNIHNPNGDSISFTKKALLTNPQGEPRGQVGTPQTETLQPNEGLDLTCKNVEDLLGLDPPPFFFIGFVVLESRHELDVVGVYTIVNVLSIGT